MSAPPDSGELFTIRNQFYTGQHTKVAAYDWALFSPQAQLKVYEFQVRSALALAHDPAALLGKGRAAFPEHPALLAVLQAWSDVSASGVDDASYFAAVGDAAFEAQAVLAALYLVKYRQDVDGAISLLARFSARGTENALELEPHLLLVQLHLHKENFAEASRVYQRFQTLPFDARDDIIYHVMESWINSVKGQADNISNAYYFYDELLSSDFDDDVQGRFHNLSALFVMTLQLKHFPEAQEILDQVAALDYRGTGAANLVANRITYEYLTNNGANVVALLKELAAADPAHQLLTDFREKNERFDAIVEKYLVA
ncbi:hypothetical protein METBIDRAFT_36654 [Metschnikowia bicuspidata var. bicuspidata NRRL YB-4993]|uniref:Coatomer subunit epsilon n=1 Tax=Metschnikowia bicuspidata var. bicuspidata NRRL YB-4993 TaxID=869754 RepID=A0A1A0HI25_9ASCO|nr:hypothetical protein METBIDRAFT_36654 [Metschnikowia bicuspidata var. bicuspidata NRRL YB-4993]OBA23814.1 hypothetical protein METBIDRAFT_36654 [Metschnikowia bicuspidata var. bicuspidata NRRL YB-4993]